MPNLCQFPFSKTSNYAQPIYKLLSTTDQIPIPNEISTVLLEYLCRYVPIDIFS
jgi:hypothetical protein